MADHGRQAESADEEGNERQQTSLADGADVRTRVWELHLRGLPRTRIAEQVGLNRQTVGRYIAVCLREMGAEQRQKRRQMLAAAVARMRRVQQQAWEDHDADDERERSVLALVLGEGSSSGSEQGDGHGERERERAGGRMMARYQSQRSQYLRVILDAEREIARLCGLYEAGLAVDAAVVFRIERVASESTPSRADTVLDDADEGS
jgi:hypothetical protein